MELPATCRRRTDVGAHSDTSCRLHYRRHACSRAYLGNQPPAQLLYPPARFGRRLHQTGWRRIVLRVEGRGAILGCRRRRSDSAEGGLELSEAKPDLRSAPRPYRFLRRALRRMHRRWRVRHATGRWLLRGLDHVAAGRPFQGRTRHTGVVRR